MGCCNKRTISVAVLYIALLSRVSDAMPVVIGYNPNLFTDIRVCASQWIMQTPAHLMDNSELASRLTDKPNYGVQYLFLLEPYLTYLLTLNDKDTAAPSYQEVFENYCNKNTGVHVFISCVKKSKSFQSDLSLVRGSAGDSVNILENLHSRYCNTTGEVKSQVLSELSHGSTSKEIQRLARYITQSKTNGTLICYDVIESSMQTLAQLLSDDHIQIKGFFNVLTRGVETFTRCLMVTVSPNEKALVLKQHLEMVLLSLIDSNIADVTRVEMSVARQTVSLAGYGNILVQGKDIQDCSRMGTQRLLDNNYMLLTGTLLYERINGSHFPYLAAIHIKFPVYDELTLRQIGEITYSSGMDDPLETELVVWWWSETEEMMARASAYDHGISIENVRTKKVEIVDLRTGTYIALSREGNMLTLVVRMFTTFLYQSSGLLLETCRNGGQTPVYAGVLETSKDCRAICYLTESVDISSMCQKDCLMSGNVQQLSGVYDELEAMYNVAVMKDDLIEKMSAIENEPVPIKVPGDEPISLPPHPTMQYGYGSKTTIDVGGYNIKLATMPPSTTHRAATTGSGAAEVVQTTRKNYLPDELALGAGTGSATLPVSNYWLLLILGSTLIC